MVCRVRLDTVAANDDRHGAASCRFLVDHIQLWIGSLEPRDPVEPALVGTDHDGAPVSQHARLVGSVVGRQPDRLYQ